MGMNILSEDEDMDLYNEDELSLAAMVGGPKESRNRKKSAAVHNTLYGNDADAKAKAKASRDNGEPPAKMPGVQQVSNNSSTSWPTQVD